MFSSRSRRRILASAALGLASIGLVIGPATAAAPTTQDGVVITLENAAEVAGVGNVVAAAQTEATSSPSATETATESATESTTESATESATDTGSNEPNNSKFTSIIVMVLIAGGTALAMKRRS